MRIFDTRGALVRVDRNRALGGGEQSAAVEQLLFADAIGEEAELANADESGSQNVEEETADELDRVQGHSLGSGVIGVVFPVKADAAVFQRETCLNLEGQITGFDVDANNTTHGFLREPDGTITPFDAPGAGTGNFLGSIAASINLEGEITGYFVDSNNLAHGFVRTPGGRFTSFQVPSASTNSGEGTAAFSINLLGAIAGEFLYSSNTYNTFTAINVMSSGCRCSRR
jgi:hypothetical protein